MLKLLDKEPIGIEVAEKEVAAEVQKKKRYLLFDSGCSTCTDVAHSVEQETDGWLTARSLREEEVQSQLSKARPNWKWEPALMEVEGDEVLVFTGLQMKMRMLVGLGPRKTARIARIVRQAGAGELNIEMTLSPSKEDPEIYTINSIKHIDRRTALKRMAAVGLGAALLPALPQSVFAQEGTTAEEESRESSGAKIVASTKNMTRRRAKRAFAVARRSRHGNKLHRHLSGRKFLPDSAKIRGGFVTTRKTLAGNAKTIHKTWFVVVGYKKRGSRDKAVFTFSVTKITSIAGNSKATTRKVTTDATYQKGKRLDAYSIRKGRVGRVQTIKDVVAYRRRLKNRSSQSEAASRSSQGWRCSLCRGVAPYILPLPCTIAVSAAVLIGCWGTAGLYWFCVTVTGYILRIHCIHNFVDTPTEACNEIAIANC